MSIPCSSRRIHRLAWIAGLAVAAVCTALPALAQATGCEAVFAAQTKLWETPYHSVSIDSSGTEKALHGGKPSLVEIVMVGGVL
ncbi:MAG: hypothetical protein ACRENC_19430, partial [Gemmatimonadaceae bacterium]